MPDLEADDLVACFVSRVIVSDYRDVGDYHVVDAVVTIGSKNRCSSAICHARIKSISSTTNSNNNML